MSDNGALSGAGYLNLKGIFLNQKKASIAATALFCGKTL